mgnify:FL=1
MGERVTAGKLADGTFGLQVSKDSVSVTGGVGTEDLVFDSRRHRTGVMYGGGFLSSVSSAITLNISSKPTLSYIPLVTYQETAVGEEEVNTDNTDQNGEGEEKFEYCSRVDMHETTPTSFRPCEMAKDYTLSGSSSSAGYKSMIRNGRSTFANCTNLNYKVLRIPLAYGYMNDASLWTGSGSTKRVLIGKNTNSNHGFSNGSPGFGIFVSRPGKDVTTCSADELILNTSNTNQTGSGFVSAGMFQALAVRTVAGVPRADFTTVSTSSGATQAVTNIYSHLGTVGGVDLGIPALPQSNTTAAASGSGSNQGSTASIGTSFNTSGTEITFTSSTNTVLNVAIMPTFSNLSAF